MTKYTHDNKHKQTTQKTQKNNSKQGITNRKQNAHTQFDT